jgi:DNA primase
MIEKASVGINDWIKTPERVQSVALDRDSISAFPPALQSQPARDYLYGRNITDERAIELFDLRYDKVQNRIVCPVWSANNDLVGAVGRRLDNREPRYYNYFNFESGKALGGITLISDNPRLIICEGFFDAVNCYSWADSLGADVLCTWKAELSKYQAKQILILDKAVSVWYDGDLAGNNGWKKAQKLLGKYTYGLRRAVLPEGKDLGDLSSPEFRAIYISIYGESYE